MSREFEGKVVLVTGASRGIGRAVSLAFARRGARMVLVARSVDALAEVASAVRALGSDAVAVAADVTDGPSVDKMVESATAAFGRVDVLVNNAGIARVGGVESAGFESDVSDTMAASLFGMIRVTRQVLPLMRRQGSGTVVNMSSVMGRKAFARFGSYAMVMHGVSAFSDALRQELSGTGIRVSVIHPALTATDLLRDADESRMPPPFRHMTPMSPDRVAEAIVDAVRRGKRRVVLPATANMLLLGEAISPRIGDAIARALTFRPVARLLGMAGGGNYHQTIGQSQSQSQSPSPVPSAA